MSLLRQKRRCFIFVSDDRWVQMKAAERSQHSSSDPLKEYSKYNLSSIASIYDRKSTLKNLFTVIHLEI